MDINKNQQVNTFLKGMNTDISDSLIDSSQYRYAENLQLTTNTEHNTGELRLVEGNTLLHNFGSGGRIIYVNSIRDYVVVIYATNTNWSIYVNDNKGVGEWTCIFGPCGTSASDEQLLWDDSPANAAISGVLRYESANNIKLYITDSTRRHVIIPIQIDRTHWPEGSAETNLVKLTGYQDIFLNAPHAELGAGLGHINPAKVQYIYRLYKNGGAATTLSPVGNAVSIYKDKYNGYSDKEISNKSVNITIPLDHIQSVNRLQLFRISYQYNGQTPTIHKIQDREIDITQPSIIIEDYGENIEQLGLDELLSLTQMQIKPKLIESKGDTLFAANLKYVQDDVDTQFKDYDARSFSSGNYWELKTPIIAQSNTDRFRWDESLAPVWRKVVSTDSDYSTFEMTQAPIEFDLVGNNECRGGTFVSEDGATLCHRQFTNNFDHTYNVKWWRPFGQASGQGENISIIPDEVGGKGTNIDWRFDEKWIEIHNDGTRKTYRKVGPSYSWSYELVEDDSSNNRAYYKCDETYRFGVILYNERGQASSVKWIADIRIPPRSKDDYDFSADGTHFGEGVCRIKVYDIVFKVKNFPEDCSGMQFVQCPRSINDRYVLSQGFVGASQRVKNEYTNQVTNYTCTPGIMTMQYINTDNVAANDNDTWHRTSETCYDLLQFASPEYAYQSDDVKNMISTYKNQVHLTHVTAFDIYAEQNTSILNDGTGNDIVYSKTSANPNLGFGFRRVSVGSSGSYLRVTGTETLHEVPQELLGTPYNPFQSGWASEEVYCSANRNYGQGRTQRIILNTADPGNKYKWGYIAFNHMLPKYKLEAGHYKAIYPSISKIAYPAVPEWNKFADGEQIRFNDDVTPIGNYSFINWSYPGCIDLDLGKDGDVAGILKDTGDGRDNDRPKAGALYPCGTGGKYILFKLESGVTFKNDSNNTQDRFYCLSNGNSLLAPIHVANLVKDCVPYGGYTDIAIKNSQFCGFGNVISKDAFDNYHAQTGVLSTDPYDIVANGGDSYISWFKFNANHLWHDPIYITATKCATVYEVPVETDIDLDAAYGARYDSSDAKGYYIQDEAASFQGFSQQVPAYQYNTAYNQIPNVISYSSTEKTDISNEDWDIRIHNSDLKTNGESIDSWLTFKALNYLDVDSRHGEITELKLFKDRLMFWQDDAVGVLSSNERTMLNDASGNQIILGNGGILQRSDYVSTTYGMKKNQFADTQSNTTLYWWDGNNKEILAYTENGLLPLGSLKAVRNYLNEHNENAHPYMFYDIKNKEVVSSIVNNESLVYSEQIEAFSSIYKFAPLYGTELADQIFTTNDTAIYKQNVTENNESELFGQPMLPKLQYVVNSQNMFPKVFDIQTFGGRFYGGDDLTSLRFDYKTPLKQHSNCTGSAVTNREYDFRLDIPRNNNDVYGGRMRGKTMECEFSSTSNSTDFSLQYIVTKYRMSWS